jgi:hypothetical protein
VVVVDTQRLVEGQIEAATRRMQSGESMTQEGLEMEGKVFGRDFLTVLGRYRDEGALVIDKRHALAIPAGLDVTDAIAAELGVPIAPAVDIYKVQDPQVSMK